MAYNPSTNIVVSGKTFTDVPSVLFKTPDGSTVNFAHVGGQIRFSPTLEEQTQNVANYEDVIIDPITSTLLNQLDSDFVAENIKKDVDLFGLVGTLEAGGGGGDFNFGGYLNITKVTSGIYTVTENVKRVFIQHGLGEIPKIIIALPEYDPSVNTDYRGFGCFLAVLPSNDKFISCTFRVNGSDNVRGGTSTEFLDLSHLNNALGTGYSTSASSNSFMFGTGSNNSQYYTILAGTTFHWIAMA